MPMFEHFTATAIRVILFAQQEARRQRHNYVGNEHVFLGLIIKDNQSFKNPHFTDVPFGLATEALANAGVTLSEARKHADQIDSQKTIVDVEIPFTPRCKKLLVSSCAIANELCDKIVDTEHLLLAFLDDPESAGYKVFIALSVNENNLRQDLFCLKADSRKLPVFEGSTQELVQTTAWKDTWGFLPDNEIEQQNQIMIGKVEKLKGLERAVWQLRFGQGGLNRSEERVARMIGLTVEELRDIETTVSRRFRETDN